MNFSKSFSYVRKVLFIGLVGLLTAGILSSCTQKTEQSLTNLPADSTITQTIKSQYASAVDVPAQNLDVATENGVVTLRGSTTNLLAKKRATEIAQATSGVISVANNLQVTFSRPDEAVNEDVIEAISTNPATEYWEITSTVNNGLVTLKGAVDSWQEKQLATKIVSGIKGVKGITNSIIISNDEDRNASDIKAEVKSTLMYDSRVRDNMINVAVDSSVVTLSGSVGSATEKQLAIERAHVRGVNKVIAEQLDVRPEYDNKMLINKKVTDLTATQIEESIKRVFRYDPRVPADQITVNVSDKTATLNGTVKHLNFKLAAAEDAKHTAGVNKVINNINVKRKVVVKPEVATTDGAIATRIKSGVQRDPYVEETEINVSVENGLVVLKGNVSSEFEQNQIQEIAQNVKGVISVENNLVIDSNSEMTL